MGSGEGEQLALVVDDEVFARMFATRILLDEGFTTLEAQSTVEALDVLDAYGSVAVLFTSVCMSGDRDGLALAWQVAQSHPSVTIVVTSGQVQPSSAELPDRAVFLAKPYTAHSLKRAIRQAI